MTTTPESRYCISVGSEHSSTLEGLWEKNGLNYDCWGAGCGTCEYDFPTKDERDRAWDLVCKLEEVGVDLEKAKFLLVDGEFLPEDE